MDEPIQNQEEADFDPKKAKPILAVDDPVETPIDPLEDAEEEAVSGDDEDAIDLEEADPFGDRFEE